ncbi:LCP family protein [Nesterenkonia sphaerica]|uniref:LytR family transcriptional regulator n=1 Tax=Nesterenkonia sphaerica TaxID=1804988 RepID=A0A5R9ABU1_9MICC|nr:LCP family protein [Nesterenkonia sphaerica]TLP75317.1 LytR family transcriptional regulator [Nesterenkonia sphaerica]
MSEQHRPRRARGGAVPPSPPASAPAPAQAEDPAPRPGRRKRIILISLAVLATLLLIGGIVAYSYVNRLQTVFEEERNVIEELDDLDDDTAYRTPEGTVNVLLLGSDSRGEDDTDYRAQTGEEGERSDAMMLVHIPEDRSGIYVMSIMRDLWVEIPGQGEGRINTALSAGGLDLAVDTVEDLLYTHIDHVVTINFDGFEDLTTALGGVYVDNPRPFAAGQQNPAFYPEGTIRLQGSDALRFVRERKSFPTNDHVRVENQQLVMRAIAERFLSGDTLTNPQRIFAVLEAILPYMEMDGGLDANTIVGYGLDMTHMRGRDIHTFTMPSGEPHTTSGGAQVILPDEDMMDLLRRSLSSENMSGFVRYTEALDPDSAGGAFTVSEDDDELSRQLGRQLGESLDGEE